MAESPIPKLSIPNSLHQRLAMASPSPTIADPLKAPLSSPPDSPHGAPPSPQQQQQAALTSLTEGLLEEIFLRVTDRADLARSSVACTAFLRIITSPSFARRFRLLHSTLLGLLDLGHFHATEPPHPSAGAAQALDRAADFTLSFLPPCCERDAFWMPVDSSDGRVLMADIPMLTRRWDRYHFSHLLVCDPLYRRYVRLPPIPEDLAASILSALEEIFLVPVEDGEEGTSFRVVYMLKNTINLVAFVFSSRTGQWRAAPFHGWSAEVGVFDSIKSILNWRNYACGCFYWKLDQRNKLLVLEASSMEFSTVDLPPSDNMQHIGIVDAGGGRIGVFSLRNHTENRNCDLHYTIRRNEGQWQLERIIPFPFNYEGYTIGAATRCLFLWGTPNGGDSVGSQQERSTEFVSLDVKALEFQRIGVSHRHWLFNPLPYFGYPPSLSRPSI